MSITYYSIIGIVAILIHIIINNDLLWGKNRKLYYAAYEYRVYLWVVLAYYIIDVLWGVAAEWGNETFLYVDTVAYFLAMALSVVSWCRYVISFLQLHSVMAKSLNIFGGAFLAVDVVALVINHFDHMVFWFDSDGTYHAFMFRYAALSAQILMFLVVAIFAFASAAHASHEAKRRNTTMGIFGFAMVATVFIQIYYPLLPVYTVGLMIGICLLHVFVQEDQKEQYRNQMKSQSDIIANAGFGLWRIYLKDGEEPRMQVTPKMAELLAIDSCTMTEEDVYAWWFENIVPDAVPSVNASVQEMIDGKMSENTYQWIHPDDGVIYVRCGGVCQILEDGTKLLSGYHANVTDIVRDEKEKEEQLHAAMKAAEAANEAKTTFLFNMSHDIRTPMNAIIGYTDLLEKYRDDAEKCYDYLGKIRSSSDFLLSLINNVLEMARIESGKIALEEQPCSLRDICAEIGDVYAEQMKSKQIRFNLDYQVKTEYIYCDRVKINEVLLNLVSNAYKYTPEGGEIFVRLEELPCKKKGYVNIQATIADNGIGMSKEYLPTIFDQFTRERNTTDVKIQGTGLGMAIVKRLVDFMGGTITVESELGVGTTFVVTIPHRVADSLYESPAKEIEEHAAVDFFGKRILLAEDNDLNAEIAEELLSDEGFLVERAVNGAVCVEMMEREVASYYDIILMDIQMPVMDGYEATKRIRDLEDEEKRVIPIIAMTANAFSEDKANAYAAGMNAHLSKPINIKDLFEILAIYSK